ncbi:MAG: GTPase ObgE [Trueperaceae bacterium]
MAFRDTLDIVVQGGKGGDGGLSFLRLKYMPKGGPDGGHGGDGGSVYLVAVDDVTSLDRLLGGGSFRAGTGMQGEGRNKAGQSAGDLTLQVPVGTTVSDIDSGELVADLIEVGEQALVARGGVGGRGNASFATSRRQAPRFHEYGTPGEKRRLRLELRTIADAGLVGYPNAGKSSLLAVLSNARPVIASYPFTTLTPNLGVVEGGVESGMVRLTLADIPGIIEDAHLGKGLGLEFLRHISRTRLLVFVLDIAEAPPVQFKALRHELEEYDPSLLELPSVVVLNKVDLADPSEVVDLERELAGFGLPVVSVSAERGDALDSLRDTLFALLPERPALEARQQEVKTVRAQPLQVRRDMAGTGWVVSGRPLEEIVARFDPNNKEAVAYLQHHFTSQGVNKLLAKAGARDGEEVQIGGAVFEYFDESRSERSSSAETDTNESQSIGFEMNESEANESEANESETDAQGLPGPSKDLPG